MTNNRNQCTSALADHFFTNGAGLLSNRDKKRLASDGVNVYSQVFSKDKLKDAHQYCWETFKQAVEEVQYGKKINRIVLDNTNSRKCEYEKYLKYAVDKGLTFVVIEVACSGPFQVSTFCKRSKHKVPHKVAHHMFTRWEYDERALILESSDRDQQNIKSKHVKFI